MPISRERCRGETGDRSFSAFSPSRSVCEFLLEREDEGINMRMEIESWHKIAKAKT